MKTFDPGEIEVSIRHWIEKIVVGEGFCPFAAPVFRQNRIRYALAEGNSSEQLLEGFAVQLYQLQLEPKISTTLYIFPVQLKDFIDFLDHLELAESLLEQLGFEGFFQIANFHPEYQFADTELDDPANFTNRAPFPIWQLLRESELTQVLANYEEPEQIPERNIRHARHLGIEYFKEILKR